MPVIVFASSKGGAGKSTACVLVGSELARQGLDKNIRIALLDADPNSHSSGWAILDGCPSNIEIMNNLNENNILDAIDLAKKTCPFVLIDLEGVSSNTVTFAISQADLVIIPCQPSQNDAKEAVKTLKMVKNSSRLIGKNIPSWILFTRLSAAIVTKTSRSLLSDFKAANVNVFSTSLIDREVFRSIFSFGGTIDKFKNFEKAQINVNSLVSEIKNILKKGK